ncbi:ABC transporter permease [Microbulbifer sp. TYP-18]|uniref:ABC transporter permease n=1 Tax=Microbulbifer sp. TYP-18 TaxID=3230024 RepID=UPI0034C5EB82
MSVVKDLFSRQMRALTGKEFLEVWRDRRALMIAAAFTLLFPALMVGAGSLSLKVLSEDHANVAVIGAEYAPLLVERLRGDGLQLELLDEGSPPELLRERYDLVLQIEAAFEERYRDLSTPQIYLYLDGSEQSGGRGAQLLQARLNGLERIVAQQRLSAQGIAPGLLAPWQLQVRDVSTPSSRAVAVLGTLVQVLLISALLVCSAAPSIDTSAGERERMSIEILLQQPLRGWQIIVAKVLAVTSIGWLGALISLAVLTIAFALLPLADIGVQFSADAWSSLVMGLLLLPLALLVAVLQILLALRSRSFKDAQIQLNILQGLPLMLLVVWNLSGIDLEASAWQLIPFLGQQLWLNLLMAGEPVSVPMALAGSLVTLSAVGLCILVGARALRRESLLGAA